MGAPRAHPQTGESGAWGVGTGEVRVLRGGVVESRHAFHVVVADADGVRAVAGDPDRLTWYRSASKPFQALPLVEDGVAERFGLGAEELALCCASHNSQARHVEVARRILAAAGVEESALGCGGHWPIRQEETARFIREGRRPGPVESNCSGKHAGMLALAAHHGWPLEGYLEADHPVQRRMAREVARWSGVEEGEMATGVDGCGVVCFAVPLRRMAEAWARFGEAAAAGDPGPATLVEAMTAHPFLVAGDGRLCTDLMAVGEGVVAKVGAEGVYGAAVPSRGVGIALKVEDGAMRASEPALVAVLDALGFLSSGALDRLDRYRRPRVRNTRREEVGEMEVFLELVGVQG